MPIKKKSCGFALVTVLLLMGFLVALVLGVSVLLNIDCRLESNLSGIEREKAYGRLGLREGLGKLQEQLGVDQRITALLEEGEDLGRVGVFDARERVFIGFLGGREREGQVLGEGGEVVGRYGYTIEDMGLTGDFDKAFGVLSDVKWGGLREDLSGFLRGLDKKEGRIFEDEGVRREADYIPKWEYLRSFYELARECQASGGHGNERSLKPRGVSYESEGQDGRKPVFFPEIISKIFGRVGQSTTPLEHGVGPVIVGCGFGFAPEFARDDGSKEAQNTAGIRYFVTVALWNPYDFALAQEDYVFNIKPEGKGGEIEMGNRDYGAFKFSGKIRSDFKAGEIRLFSLCGDGTLKLISEGGGDLGAIMHSEGKGISGSDRGEGGRSRGGFVFDNKRVVSWKKPLFSLELLSGGENALYQVVYRLGGNQLDKGEVFSQVLDQDDYGVKGGPLFAIVFKNGGGGQEALMHYNPRALVVDGMRGMRFPYELKVYGGQGGQSRGSQMLEVQDFPAARYGRIFSMPESCTSLGFLRHVNFGALERHAGCAFGNAVCHKDIARSGVRGEEEGMYFYDYSYQLNEALWDSCFLSGRGEGRQEDFEKNFVELGEGGGILLKGVFNVNSVEEAGWAKLFSGVRGLGVREIDRLARAMVEGVKERGPFFSLGDFVNRRLEDSVWGDLGVLQEALNRAGIKLTQAEVLESIGHKLAVRSDTFVIRAYGEVVEGPLGVVRGRSCCEAVVQRVPEYLELEEDGHLAVNRRFGRRFKVVSFRWLGRE